MFWTHIVVSWFCIHLVREYKTTIFSMGPWSQKSRLKVKRRLSLGYESTRVTASTLLNILFQAHVAGISRAWAALGALNDSSNHLHFV